MQIDSGSVFVGHAWAEVNTARLNYLQRDNRHYNTWLTRCHTKSVQLRLWHGLIQLLHRLFDHVAGLLHGALGLPPTTRPHLHPEQMLSTGWPVTPAVLSAACRVCRAVSATFVTETLCLQREGGKEEKKKNREEEAERL